MAKSLTPLHLATCNGQLLDVKLMESRLLKDPSLINARTLVIEGDGQEMSYTPLHMAARANHVRCVVFLLQKDPKRRQEADVNATFGRHHLNALALAKDSPCTSLLLLNGICVDYAPPSHLGRAIEFPCTLYVNVACQSNNPSVLAALLQRGAATLDAEFVDWHLANNNSDAVYEDTPLCIAASVGGVECVRLLLLHKADVTVVFPSDPRRRPLLEYLLDRVFDRCEQLAGERILETLWQFGAAFDACSAPLLAHHKQLCRVGADFTKRMLLLEFERLAELPLSVQSQRRLAIFRRYRDWHHFVSKGLGEKLDADNVVMGTAERDQIKQFLMFKDLIFPSSEHSVK